MSKSSIKKNVGARIRYHRKRLRISQDKLAERSGLNPSYIGQIERGERNATLESMEKIAIGLDVSFATLFEDLPVGNGKKGITSECFEILSGMSLKQQTVMLEIMKQIVAFKKTK